MADNGREEYDNPNTLQNEACLEEGEMEKQGRSTILPCKRKKENIENIEGKSCSLLGLPLHLPGHHYHCGIQGEVMRCEYGDHRIHSPHFSHYFPSPATLHYKLNLTQHKLDLYQQKFEQAMKDLERLKGALKSLAKEKVKIMSEKDQLAESLHKTEEMVECFKNKSNQLAELHTQHEQLKHDLECVVREKNQLSEEKAKIANELSSAEEKLEQKAEQLDEAQPQLDGLKGELKRVKSEASKELMTMTQLLKHKENTFTRFVEEFNSMKVDPNVYRMDDCFHCLICMKPVTQSEYGEHNICSLACGHFFGRSCITKLIQQHAFDHSAKCPICHKTTTLADIRNH